MLNPKIVVTVITEKSNPSIPLWSETAEGQSYTTGLIEVLNSYGPDIEITSSLNDDGTVSTAIVSYKTKEVYDQSRNQLLMLFPDFYEKRNAYAAANQIKHTHNVQELPD